MMKQLPVRLGTANEQLPTVENFSIMIDIIEKMNSRGAASAAEECTLRHVILPPDLHAAHDHAIFTH